MEMYGQLILPRTIEYDYITMTTCSLTAVLLLMLVTSYDLAMQMSTNVVVILASVRGLQPSLYQCYVQTNNMQRCDYLILRMSGGLETA